MTVTRPPRSSTTAVDRSSPPTGTASTSSPSSASSRAAACPVRPGVKPTSSAGASQRLRDARDVDALAAGGDRDVIEPQDLAGPQLVDGERAVDREVRAGDEHAMWPV